MYRQSKKENKKTFKADREAKAHIKAKEGCTEK